LSPADIPRVDEIVLATVNEAAPLSSLSRYTSGIVVDTVNRVSALDAGGAGVASVAAVARPLTAHRQLDLWNSVAVFTKRPGLLLGEPEGLTGFSLRLGLTRDAVDGGSNSQVIVEALVRDRTLVVQLSTSVESGKRIADMRVLRGDGGPMPGWLERVGANLLIGNRPADVGQVQLRVIVVYEDGTSEEKDVQIESVTGEVTPRLVGKSGMVPSPFMDRFAEVDPPTDDDRRVLARQLDAAVVP
jgi:hypothetical protein